MAAVTFVVVVVLAWKNGRTYCNTICPVGTTLGLISRYSLFRITIDESKCNKCGLCSRKCKAACIDGQNHRIDYSRCVACMDCIDTCKHGAVSYRLNRVKKADIRLSDNIKNTKESGGVDAKRRDFLSITATLAATAVAKAQEKKVDGGLAVIEDKKVPERTTPVVPPGAESIRDFSRHCTAC